MWIKKNPEQNFWIQNWTRWSEMPFDFTMGSEVKISTKLDFLELNYVFTVLAHIGSNRVEISFRPKRVPVIENFKTRSKMTSVPFWNECSSRNKRISKWANIGQVNFELRKTQFWQTRFFLNRCSCSIPTCRAKIRSQFSPPPLPLSG